MRSRFPGWVAKTIIAPLILPLWAASAGAVPVGITFTPTPTTAVAAGDPLIVTVRLDDAVSFNTLDATLTWDNSYLAPADEVSSDPFLALGGVFTFAGSGFAPVIYDVSTPGTLTIGLISDPDPAQSASGAGDLFSLKFQVRSGVALPASTRIDLNTLALNLIFEQNGDFIDPPLDPYDAASSLSVSLLSPAAVIPEPSTGLLWLAGLLAMGGFGVRRVRH